MELAIPNHRLAMAFSRLAAQQERLLDDLRTWPVEQLTIIPDPRTWSPLQILEHLILTEHVVLEMMKTHRAAPHRITIVGQMRSAIVVAAMLLPTRVRVPDAAHAVIPEGMLHSLTEVVERWAAERREFAEFLSSLSDAEAGQGLSRHPYGGWTSAHGALLFLRSHLYHHTLQIARIRRRQS